MARKKFLRRNHDKYKRIGRKKLLKWRRQRGRHGKMREERKGYPSVPKIGMKNKIKKEIKLIRNLKSLDEMKKNQEAIIARVGKRKRQEILSKAKEMGVKILNIGAKPK